MSFYARHRPTTRDVDFANHLKSLPVDRLVALVKTDASIALFCLRDKQLGAINPENSDAPIAHIAVEHHESVALEALKDKRLAGITNRGGMTVADIAAIKHESAALVIVRDGELARFGNSFSKAAHYAVAHESTALEALKNDDIALISNNCNYTVIHAAVTHHKSAARYVIMERPEWLGLQTDAKSSVRFSIIFHHGEYFLNHALAEKEYLLKRAARVSA